MFFYTNRTKGALGSAKTSLGGYVTETQVLDDSNGLMPLLTHYRLSLSAKSDYRCIFFKVPKKCTDLSFWFNESTENDICDFSLAAISHSIIDGVAYVTPISVGTMPPNGVKFEKATENSKLLAGNFNKNDLVCLWIKRTIKDKFNQDAEAVSKKESFTLNYQFEEDFTV